MCAVSLDAPQHEAPAVFPPGERPEALPTLDDLDADLIARVRQLGGYADDRKPSIEFRIPDPRGQFVTRAQDRSFRFWIRTTESLPGAAGPRAAAFAYMSDWWLNFSSLIAHQRDVAGRRLYVASLNHAIWLHRPVAADRWLHVDSRSSTALSGGACPSVWSTTRRAVTWPP